MELGKIIDDNSDDDNDNINSNNSKNGEALSKGGILEKVIYFLLLLFLCIDSVATRLHMKCEHTKILQEQLGDSFV